MKPRIELRRLTFVSLVVLTVSVCLLCSEGVAATYYISPNGSDSGTGTSATPWKTFAFAIPKLSPGDTLILKNGTYDATNSGYLNMTKTGTAALPITIKAENERQAFIDGNGNVPFIVTNSSYLVFEGIRVRNRDVLVSNSIGGNVILVRTSRNLIFRRMLVHNNNRYYNGSIFVNEGVTDSLFEENEVYSFHRNGFTVGNGPLGGSSGNTFRRNYLNSRNYPDISGGYPSGPSDKGDGGYTVYPGSYNLFENNVAENTSSGFDLEAAGTTVGNKFYGNISIGGDRGFYATVRDGSGIGVMPRDTYIENFVSLNASSVGMYLRGNKNTILKQGTILNGTGVHGFAADLPVSCLGDGAPTIYLTNVLSSNNAGSGFYTTQQADWNSNFPNAYNNSTNFSPSATDPKILNKSTVNPLLGACRVFIPSTSSVKGAGKDGADIGANILYRYQNGVLTTQELWNTTGSFPCGAIISGVNDVAGSSCFDLHQRLNVNTNGCSFPAGYYSGTVTSAPAPSGLRIVQ